jgi:hypothetical protein
VTGRAGVGEGWGRWRSWIGLVAAFFLLNFALTLHNRWPTPLITTRHELSLELALVVLALAAWAGLRGPRPRALLAGLALLLTLFTLGRYAEVTAPALFGRRINLYWDLPHLPKVAAMLTEVLPGWQVGLLGAGLVLVPVLIWWLLRWALGRVDRALDRPHLRLGLPAAALVLVALYGAGMLSETLRTERWFSRPVTATYGEQVQFVLAARRGSQAVLPPTPGVSSDLGRVQGADVVVVFLESYGAIVHDRADLAERLAGPLEDLARAVAETGRGAVSGFVTAPTFGGYSWLSHASLMAGIEVGDNARYDLLLTQDRETLAHRFGAAGYRVLALMPGLRQAWPEGAFYDFERILGEQALDYRGPDMGWWRIPDQFAAARLGELLERGEDRPRFVFFTTISTHAPFRPTPPYQPDWGRLLTDRPFDDGPLREALDRRPDYGNQVVDYGDSMAYALSWLAGWLREQAARDLVLVVLGDHQPPAAVGGRDIPLDVPVHVITGRKDLLSALAAEGLEPGLRPSQPVLGPLHGLYVTLLRAFDAGGSALAGEAGVDIPGAVGGAEPLEHPADAASIDPRG